MTIDPSRLIVRVGAALWGGAAQSEMSRELGVAKTTVQDWRNGRAAPSAGVWRELRTIAIRRRVALGDMIEELNDAAGLE